MRWTPEQLDFLEANYRRPGWTHRRIAENMPGPPRTPRAVERMACELTLSRGKRPGKRRHDRAMRDDVEDMALMNFTLARMAAELYRQYGVTVSSYWLRSLMKAELPVTNRKWEALHSERRAAGSRRMWQRRRHQSPESVA